MSYVRLEHIVPTHTCWEEGESHKYLNNDNHISNLKLYYSIGTYDEKRWNLILMWIYIIHKLILLLMLKIIMDICMWYKIINPMILYSKFLLLDKITMIDSI